MRGRDVGELLRDYQEARRRERKSPKELAAKLADYERFIRTRSHVLRRDPAQLFAQGVAQPGDSVAGKDFRRLAEEGRGPEVHGSGCGNIPESDPQRGLLLTIEVGTAVHAVAWRMRDGRPYGLVGGLDGKLRLFDLVTNTLVRDYPGHTNYVTAVALSGDGRHALSGSSDRRLRWWDLESGRCLAVFDWDYPVTAVAITPERPFVAVAGDSRGRVHFFDLMGPDRE